MDFTGSQMIVTLKIISAAVTYQDGLKPEKVPMTYTPKAVRCVFLFGGQSVELFMSD